MLSHILHSDTLSEEGLDKFGKQQTGNAEKLEVTQAAAITPLSHLVCLGSAQRVQQDLHLQLCACMCVYLHAGVWACEANSTA